MKIGLIGLAGSGKSYILKTISRYDFDVIEVDKIGHEALKDKGISSLVQDRFGTTDRSELGKIVFSDDSALRDLEAITHPWIKERVIELIEGNGNFVLDAAILFRMGLHKLVDEVWLVYASFPERLKRVEKRGWSKEELLKRDSAVVDDVLGNTDKVSKTIMNEEDDIALIEVERAFGF